MTAPPARLAETAPERWRFHRRFSLEHAQMQAARRDRLGTLGMAARAVIEHAHALLCQRREWVLNGKKIVERSGLAGVHALFADGGGGELATWVAAVEAALAPPPLSSPPRPAR